MAYSFKTSVAGLAKLEVYRKKEDFPKGITGKVDAFVQCVVKSFPYWANEDKATFKHMIAVIDDTHPALFVRLRNDLKVLVGVVTLKDMAKTTTKPDIMAELVKLSKGIESLREELAKVFAEKAKEIETPKPEPKAKAKAKAVVVEEELFPL